jgi:hypothetical protein
MAILTLLAALSIAGVAAWYSIVGLIAIFSGAAIPIAIMGAVLECGKLITATWLHQNWRKAPLLLRSYLTTAVFLLMVITSLGIFGFLSKAHLEHAISVGGTNELQITNLERQIARQQSVIADAETVLAQLDQQVAVLIEYDRIRGPTGSIAVREKQSGERSLLNETIDAAYIRIDGLQKDLTPLLQEKLALEVEVGPLKYIAELIYGDEAEDYFGAAVRWVIILLVVVFDPLAITLLLAANVSLAQRKEISYLTEEEILKDVDIVAPPVVEPIDDETTVDFDLPDEVELEEYEVMKDSFAVDDAARVMAESAAKKEPKKVWRWGKRWRQRDDGHYDLEE